MCRLAASQDFLGMEEGMDHNNMYQIRGLKMLYEGDGYAKLNKVTITAIIVSDITFETFSSFHILV